MSTVTISSNALDLSIPSSLTNEIPHLSIYSILNKHLRNTWSEQLIGRASANYGQDFNSQKVMNGKVSENYLPHNVTFADPERNKIYNVDLEKIDFSVDGAIETEIDYLMHENARYLTKLYPDDFNTLITLTEAERQSYINEALHMIHSYFDTEQLVAANVDSTVQEMYDLYFRNKFLTGITNVRALTGVAKQEEKLLSLINAGKIISYTGYKNYITSDGLCVITNDTTLSDISLSNLHLEGYFYIDSETIAKEALLRLHGKVRNTKLKDFLEDSIDLLELNENFFKNLKEFFVLPSTDPLEIVDDLITGKLKNTKSFNLNNLFREATAAGAIRAGANINTIKTTEFNSAVVDFVEDNPAYFCFSQATNNANLVAFADKEGNYFKLQNLENRIIATQGTLKNIKDIYVIKLGTYNYTDLSLLAIGNIVFSNITQLYKINENFATYIDSIVTSNAKLQIVVSIKQNEKLVFAGILNKSYFLNNTYTDLVNRYSIEDFDKNLTATEIFSHVLYKDLVEDISLDVKKEITITYSNLLLDQEKYLNDTAVIYLDEAPSTIKDYKIFINKNDINYDIVVTYIDSEDKTITYTGSTENGILTSKELTNTLSCSLHNHEVTIEDHTYVLPTDPNDTFIRRKSDDTIVGRYATHTDGDIKYFSIDILNLLKSSDLNVRTSGNLVLVDYEQSNLIYHNDAMLNSNTSATNTLEIEIDWFIDLQTLIESTTNLNIVTSLYTISSEEAEDSKQYLYSTALELKSGAFTNPDCTINNVNLASILFNSDSVDLFKLQTYKCYFYANNYLRINKDITDLTSTYGRINCIIIDNYNNYYPAKIEKSNVKNEYCYVKLINEIENLTNKDNREGYLVLDLEKKLENSLDLDTSEKERRSLKSKNIYVFENQKYLYKYTWEDLSKKNLNYVFNNLFSENVTTSYAVDSKISQNTNIPASLSELENCTIFDAINVDMNTKTLLENLIDENKSLYLDSTVKSLINVPLAIKNLVYNTQYNTISYTLTNSIPSYITFYKFNDYNQYKPLQDLLDNLDKNEVSLVELEKRLNRRLVIWGSVIWDANVNDRTIQVLRTIWSSYFSNFEIYDSEDLIPDESILYSFSNTDNFFTKTQNILNYNYSENDGTPDLNWNISLAFSKQNINNILVDTVDAYSNKQNKVNELTIFSKNNNLSTLYINNFYFYLNKVSTIDNLLKLTLVENKANLLNLKDINVDLIDITDKLHLKYNIQNTSYRAILDEDLKINNSITLSKSSKHKLNLIYNMIHVDEENFESAGIFNAYSGNNIALEMLLEFYTYQYFANTYKGYSSNIDNFLKTNVIDSSSFESSYFEYFKNMLFDTDQDIVWGKNTEKELKMQNILDFAINLTKDFSIPSIAVIDKKGNIKINAFIITKEAENNYHIYSTVFIEKANGDLLYSILPTYYKKFQIKSSLFNVYAQSLNSYQYLIPNEATGSIYDLSIDLQTTEDKDKVLVPSNNLNTSTYNSKQDFLDTFTDTNKKILLNQEKNYLTNIFDKNVSVDETTLNIQDRQYKFSNEDLAFREYYNTNVQLSTTEPINSDFDIKRCIIHFNDNFKLTNKGYLYLYDIKASNKRTTYLPSRETQIVDRSYTISNLNIIGYSLKDTSFKLLLQDNNKTYTKYTSKAIEEITPINSDLNTQQITDTQLKLGLTWNDPGLNIGYTFYKRKFFAEGVINSSDTSTITLNDTSLLNDDDFSLTDHINVGDSVEIYISNPSSFFQEGQLVELNTTADDDSYIGPYKVIYTHTKTIAASATSDEIQAIQQVILAGPGNLVYVNIDLTNTNLTISAPYVFDTTYKYTAYALSSGEIVYYDTSTKSTMLICNIQDFIDVSGTLQNVSKPESVSIVATTQQTSDGSTKLTVSSYNQEDKLVRTHDEWYSFDNSDTGADITDATSTTNLPSASDLTEDDLADVNTNVVILSEEPVRVLSSIPLNDDYLNFDNYDRSYVESTDLENDSNTNWKNIPDKLEFFDASEHFDSFSIIDSNTQTESIIQIDNATSSQLKDFIRETLIGMFGSISLEDTTENINALNSVSDINSIKKLLASDNPTFEIPATTEGNQIEVSLAALAKVIYQKNSGTINLKTDTIYIPNLQTYDIPTYYKLGSSPKWKKVFVVTDSANETLDNASLDELKTFARAILPNNNIIREDFQITNWTKSKNNIAIFDQYTATLIITDKNGNFINKIAIPSLGIEQPIVSQNFSNNSTATAYSIPNRLYVSSNVAFNNYIARSNDLDKIVLTDETDEETEYGIYEVFNKGNPLYLPDLFKSYTGKSVEDISNLIETNYSTSIDEDRINEVANTIYIASNKNSFDSWLNTCKHLNYLAPDGCNYAAFKNINYVCNLNNLQYAIQIIIGEETDAYVACSAILQICQSSLIDQVVKGVDYFDNNTNNYKDLVNKNLTSVSTTGRSIYSFESLINTANIELTNNYVHIYGTINWPAISGDDSILEKVAVQLRTKLSSEEDVGEVSVENIVTNITNEIKADLLSNFANFYGEEAYPENGATKDFKIAVNLDTYYVTKSQTISSNENNSVLPILSLKDTGESLEALTTSGTFTLGDENSNILNIDSADLTKVNIKKSILYVYEALKTLNNFSDNLNVTSEGTLQVNLSGLTIQNEDTFYSKVASVSDKSIRLEYDTIVLDDNTQTDVIFMVKSLTKDNFQYGYGNISELDSILPTQTLFEVASSNYADFATYENQASYEKYDSALGIYRKDSVFDLYPTFEAIDTDKKDKFYLLDSNKNVKYVENNFGRKIIRISNIYNEAGGRIVTRNKNVTVANEYINEEYINNTNENINSILLSTKRISDISFNNLAEKYNLQYIPALVSNPWEAILNNAYKELDISINSGNINTYDNYAIVDVKLSNNLSISISKDTVSIDNTKLDVNNTVKDSNETQTTDILANNTSLTNNWQSLPINIKLIELKLKIINRTSNLPKFYSITKYKSSKDSSNNLVLNTESNELYIPEKGYGQAIIGEYTTPENCLFEDKTFFDSSLKTLNKNNEQFVLVNKNGELYNNTQILIPKLIYKSFAQADTALSKELATTSSIDVADSLINLTYFDVDNQNIYFEKAYKLNFLNFAGNSTNAEESINYSNYEKFLSNLSFSCKLCWSEQDPNITTNNVINLTNVNSDYYSNTELLNSLGYTRLYKNNSIPANYKYLNNDNTYSVTSGAVLRDQSKYSADENGNLLYLDRNGNITTTKTVNDPLPAAKNLNTLILLSINNSTINTVVNNCFYLSKYYIGLDYNNKYINVLNSSTTRSILVVSDPNKASSNFNYIQDVTEDSYKWSKGTSLNWKFSTDHLRFSLSYSDAIKDYNFAYLHDKDGNLVAKVFFKDNIDEDSLLVLSKEI